MACYAATYHHGRLEGAADGSAIREVFAFPTRAARDAWVADRPTDAETAPGYRRALRVGELDTRERAALAVARYILTHPERYPDTPHPERY